jgi:hypothetical protein
MMIAQSSALEVVWMLWCGVRISNGQPPRASCARTRRHVLTPWQLVRHSHNEFTDISVSDRQPAFIRNCAATVATSQR